MRNGPRPPGPERPRRPLPPIPRNGFAPDVEKLYVALSFAVMPFDVETAQKLQEIAEPAGQAWDELARKNDVVRRALVAILETGAWGKVIQAHTPLMALAFARVNGESVRVSFSASLLAKEAENHANRGNDGNPPGA
jgi:hypothetical protein